MSKHNIEGKNILITGGAGFIGSNLAIKLMQLGAKVTILDNLSPQVHGLEPENTSNSYQKIKNITTFIKGSVTQMDDWVRALKNQEIVVHLAAETGTGQSMYTIDKYLSVNVNGTGKLFEVLANNSHSVEKIILSSSRAIFGEGKYYCNNHGDVYPSARKDEDMQKGLFECTCPYCDLPVEVLPTDEESKISPNSIYGITKATQEQIALLMGDAINIATVALRFQNVYGPGQSLNNPYTGILSIFSSLIKLGNDINVFEDGNESRDFIFIEDVCEAIIGSISHESLKGAFNVGSGIKTSVSHIAQQLVKLYEGSSKISISGNYRIGDIRHNYADISKITRAIGFCPKYDIDEGLLVFSNWVNEQVILNGQYEKSIEELRSRNMYR